MKRLLLTSYLLLLAIAPCFSQGKEKPYKWPGFVQLNDSVFISETEISIAEYAEFLHVMKFFFGSYEKFEDAFPYPNYTGWTGYQRSLNQPISLQEIYNLQDPASNVQPRVVKDVVLDTNVSYDPYIAERPIVNITKEQALLYCDLRTKAYKELYENTNDKKGWRLPANVYFRLPTEAEWMKAATGERDSIVTARVKLRVQQNGTVVSRSYCENLNTGEWIPSVVSSGNVNAIGLVNMCGNVAEMVMDSDDVLGGSFVDDMPDCKETSKYRMTTPQNNIGFRIVAVIKNRSSDLISLNKIK
jgi:formylglycine-generating enzyme required for sulfatase activity